VNFNGPVATHGHLTSGSKIQSIWKNILTDSSLWKRLLRFGKCIFDLGCIRSLYSKTYLKMWKNSKQKFHVYISTFYIRMTKFRGKSIFIVLWVKKIKNVSCKPLFYHRILSFCLADEKSQVFVKQHGSCIVCKDVHGFFFQFFDNSKYIKIAFKIKGAFAP
jgi:hypothetical protein